MSAISQKIRRVRKHSKTCMLCSNNLILLKIDDSIATSHLIRVRGNSMTFHRGNDDIWPIPPLLLSNQIKESIPVDQGYCNIDLTRIGNRERVIAFIFLARS